MEQGFKLKKSEGTTLGLNQRKKAEVGIWINSINYENDQKRCGSTKRRRAAPNM